ncbi:MAG: glycosyltransferase [Bacilli bacterium]|nr:glycosyltransferase [Bacilli bacterium]
MNFWDWLVDWFLTSFGIHLIREHPEMAQGWLNLFFTSVTFLLGVFTAFRVLYMIIGLFAKPRKYTAKPMDKRYAFALSARNEEAVIGNLIDSIHSQTYPKELVDIYVVADNCDDKTAEVARAHGAIVYERHDLAHARKGYALQFLFNELKKVIDIESYEGWFFIDSDNVLAPDFIEKMNNALQDGYDVMNAYRNVKNLSESWLSAINGMNMYRGTVFSHRPRSILRTDDGICGTGFVMRSHLLKNGWQTTGLSEDFEMTAKIIAEDGRIGYTEEAYYYDEQPATLKISMRQRLRWQRGSINAWWLWGWYLVKSFFKKPKWSKYDTYWELFPYGLMSLLMPFIHAVLSLTLYLLTPGYVGYTPWDFLSYVINLFVGQYVGGLVIGAIVIIREWRRVHFNVFQAIFYTLFWPLFDMISGPISIACLFMKISWKPIPHHVVADPEALVAEEREKQKK